MLMNRIDQLAKKQPHLATKIIHTNPPKEIFLEKRLPSLQLGMGVQTLYFYGISGGDVYQIMKGWLREDPSRQLIFLDDDLKQWRLWIEQGDCEEALLDFQVNFHFFSHDGYGREGLKEACWWGVGGEIALHILPHYREVKKDFCQKVEEELIYAIFEINNVLNEFLQKATRYSRNFFQGIIGLNRALDGRGLFGKARGIPAIFCGAGPSLQKNAHLLHNLKEQALLFAGGSAIQALASYGIQAHLGFGIDPNPQEMLRFRNHPYFELPVVYENRLDFHSISLIHGPRLLLNGSTSYTMSQWMEERFGIPHDGLLGGHSVSTFAIQVALLMGCDPLVFVGMDLCLEGEKAYAEGLEFHSPCWQEKPSTLGNEWEGRVIRQDIHGRPVRTFWKWVCESQWVSHWAQVCSSTRWINCTEGGLGFEGVPNLSLEDASQMFLGSRRDMEGLLHSVLSSCKPWKIPRRRSFSALIQLYASIERCEELVQHMLYEFEKDMENARERCVAWQARLESEEAYEVLLAYPSSILKKAIAHQARSTKAKLGGEKEQNWHAICVDVELTGFLAQMLTVQAGILEQVLEEQKEQVEYNEHKKCVFVGER